MNILLSYLEYIPLRLIRKFLFSYKTLLLIGKFIPYFRPNLNQTDPGSIVNPYLEALNKKTIPFKNIRILEIGVGATNSTGYELAFQTQSTVDMYEPFVDIDIASDSKIKESKKYPESSLQKVRRISKAEELQTYDLILSSSVLEHVSDNVALIKLLDKHLAPGGCMLHVVDYRDHFFKYPYHFLTFSKNTWNRFLNPGDLYRWRLGDHLIAFQTIGFQCEIVNSVKDTERLAELEQKIDPSFKKIPYWDILQATILVRK